LNRFDTSGEFMAFRSPRPDEVRLLGTLFHLSGMGEQRLAGLRVRDMDDGGMGSLQLAERGHEGDEHLFGRELAAVQFTDVDGVVVIATLYADTNGDPFELDVWKTDFSPLLRIPPVFEPVRG
jgi:hypothetical protein